MDTVTRGVWLFAIGALTQLGAVLVIMRGLSLGCLQDPACQTAYFDQVHGIQSVAVLSYILYLGAIYVLLKGWNERKTNLLA